MTFSPSSILAVAALAAEIPAGISRRPAARKALRCRYLAAANMKEAPVSSSA
jgi:hypothetical protein